MLALCVCAHFAKAQRKVVVSGYISDAKTGEMLIGAGVVCGLTSRSGAITGAVTNNYGFYNLSLPAGRHTLEWTYIGYASRTGTVDLTRDTVINISLEPGTLLKAAVVTARKEAGIQSTNTGALEIPSHQLASMPALFGETDVLKALQYMPGVQGGVSGNAGIYVRGGGADENLILLDDIPLYGVNHMLGIFSVFTPEAIKKVTMFKGSFPARYGGRLSSVIDVRTNDGNSKELHGLVSVGTLTDRIHLEGPIVKDRTSFSLSGRVLHTFLFTPLLKMQDIPTNYYFGDLNGKITHKFRSGDRLIATVYHGRDRFLVSQNEQEISDGGELHTTRASMGRVNLDWGNTVAALRWNHSFAGNLFANTTIAYNHYEMDTDLIYREKTKSPEYTMTGKTSLNYDSDINDVNVKIDFDYNPAPEHLIKFGAEYIYHNFSPESTDIRQHMEIEGYYEQDTVIMSLGGKTFIGHEASLYIEDDFVVGSRLSFNPGLHASLFYTRGKPYISLQPRFSGRLDVGGNVSVKASYSRMSQYVHLLSSSDISLPTDLWVPITGNIRPETADQVSLGTYWDAGDGWELSLEGYYKLMDNVLEYRDGVTVILTTSGWENKVSTGEGRAYGAEFFVQKKTGKTTGWLSYTLAKSERRFPDGSISGGEWYPYKYDRRHNISIVLNHKISDRIDVCANWKFLSGGVTTFSTRDFAVLDINGHAENVGYAPCRGNYRLPESHTLNVGVNFRKQKPRGERIWNIGVYNVYNNKNPDFVYTERSAETADDGAQHSYVRIKKVTMLPILPSFSYTRTF